MDPGNAAVLGALAGAFAALFGAGLTGLIQVYVAGRTAKAAQEAADRDRKAERAREAARAKTELYLRWLKWQSTVHVELVDAAITGETISQRISHEIADFRAEMLLHASAEVRARAERLLDVWVDYQDRYKTLVEEDAAKPAAERLPMPAIVAWAASDVVLPFVEDVAEAMRAELDALAA